MEKWINKLVLDDLVRNVTLASFSVNSILMCKVHRENYLDIFANGNLLLIHHLNFWNSNKVRVIAHRRVLRRFNTSFAFALGIYLSSRNFKSVKTKIIQNLFIIMNENITTYWCFKSLKPHFTTKCNLFMTWRLERGAPNSGTCLLNQKLQMLNCCIDKKLSREAREKEKFSATSDAMDSGCEGKRSF